MASMPAVWTSPGGSSLVRRSTPRTSTPTVCGAPCPKRAKIALQSGVAPRTARVASALLLERGAAFGGVQAGSSTRRARQPGSARRISARPFALTLCGSAPQSKPDEVFDTYKDANEPSFATVLTCTIACCGLDACGQRHGANASGDRDAR